MGISDKDLIDKIGDLADALIDRIEDSSANDAAAIFGATISTLVDGVIHSLYHEDLNEAYTKEEINTRHNFYKDLLDNDKNTINGDLNKWS